MVRLLDDTFAAIGKNPLLVARASIPWQTLAQSASAQPIIAGFQFGAANSMPPSMKPAAAETPLRSNIATPGSEDEEAAESSPDPAYEPTAVTTKPSQPQSTVAKTVTLSPPSTQKVTTVAPLAAANKIVVASLESAPPRPTLATSPTTAPESPTFAPGRTPRPRPKPSIPAPRRQRRYRYRGATGRDQLDRTDRRIRQCDARPVAACDLCAEIGRPPRAGCPYRIAV